MMKIRISLLLTLSLAIALFVVFTLISQPQHLNGMEYEVRVVNGFTDNSSLPLVIWCTSKDGDMGGRALQEHDDFSWVVRTNFWGSSTHFFCTMKWDQKRKSFDAFKVPRDSYRCGLLRKCYWLVKEDGFYFSNDDVNWKKDFSWY
ncbi:S-protein homolog 5 [Juglans microcarpa x Juglans regia]|uniref:S-protein homolog 5 n=1 Tax=Juglans microcarpa x Juglans regia TaxID=2249226 RepID=UPI001B7DF69F|nr:S-protein homolog 5 [Juglans microcarpa x Juglans regia]